MEALREITKSNLGITLSKEQIDQFSLFEKLLLKWNQKYNLTSIIDPYEILIKHFYDSLTCFSMFPANESFSLIDIGTGAGFPGIPLKIVNPLIHLSLAESVSKKADFCQLAIDELGIKQTQVLPLRAETIGQDISHREKYDRAVARAVAPLTILVEYLLPLVKVGGEALAQKGNAAADEIENAQKAIHVLGGKLGRITEIVLSNNMGNRTLIEIKKVKPTPTMYPRRPGTPKKNPLV